MQIHDRRSVVLGLFAFATVAGLTHASAQNEDVIHIVSGVVKHVDKDSKKLIVKTDDGVEHTIKWTGKTTWEGTKDSGKGIKEGSELTVRYTETAGEKTAVGVKDISKDTKKALE
jgi:Cu/Ag efflux protein CusF